MKKSKNKSQNKFKVAKKILRYFFYSLLSILILIFLILFTITTDFGSTQIIKQIKQRKDLFLNKGYTVDIGAINIDFFSEIYIKNLSLSYNNNNNNNNNNINKKSDDTFNSTKKDNNIFSVATIELSYSLYDILFENRLNSFKMEGVEIDLVQTELGLNILQALKVGGSEKDNIEHNREEDVLDIEEDIQNENTYLFIIENASITNTFLNFTDRVNNLSLESNFNLNLDYSYDEEKYLFNVNYLISEIANKNKILAKNSKFNIDVKLDLEEIIIDKFDFISKDFGLRLNTKSSISLKEELIDLDIRLNLDIEKFNDLLGTYLPSEQVGILDLSGKLDLRIISEKSNLSKPNIDVSLNSEQISFVSDKFNDENKYLDIKNLVLQANLNNDNIVLDKLKLNVLNSNLSFTGKYNITDSSFETENKISSIDLQIVSDVLSNFTDQKISLDGIVDLSLSSIGVVNDIFDSNITNLDIQLNDFIFDKKFDIGDLDLQTNITNSDIDLSIVNRGKFNLKAKTLVEVNSTDITRSSINGTFSLENFNISDYKNILEEVKLENIFGKIGLTGNYIVSDSLISLESKVKATELTGFNFRMDSINISSNVTVSKQVDSLLVEVTDISNLINIELLNSTNIRIKGNLTVPMNSKKEIFQEIAIENLFLKDYLSKLDSNIEKISGSINSKIIVAGDLSSPSISISNFKFADFALKHKLIPLDVNSGYISLKSDSNLISLDSCIFTIANEGIFSVNGNVDFDYNNIILNDIDLNIFAKNLELDEENLFRFNLNYMKLNVFKKDLDKYYVSGDIKLGNTAFIKDLDLLELLAGSSSSNSKNTQKYKTADKLEFKVKKTFKDSLNIKTKEIDIIDMFKLDINIKESDSLFIDNNIAKIRMHSELNIVGKVKKPGIVGKFSIDEGILNYLDNQFTIDKGDIFFNDINSIDPEFDILATAEIIDNNDDKYVITLTIQGPTDQLVVQLTSDPDLEKADIVSLIAFGSISGDLDGGEFAKDQVGRAVTGSLSEVLNSTVGNTIGVDAINIEGNLFDPSNSDTKIATTKRLTKRVTATYKSSLVDINDYKVIINYKLNKLFSIEGETNNRDDSGIDLIFEKEIE